jgi:hypothetical protein
MPSSPAIDILQAVPYTQQLLDPGTLHKRNGGFLHYSGCFTDSATPASRNLLDSK